MIYCDHLVVVGVRASFGAFAPGAGVWLLSEFVLFAVLSHPGWGLVVVGVLAFCGAFAPGAGRDVFKTDCELFLI